MTPETPAIDSARHPPTERAVESLSRAELAAVVFDVLQTLYLDYDSPRGYFWNPDHEWDACTLDEVAGVLRSHGLAIKPAAGALGA